MFTSTLFRRCAPALALLVALSATGCGSSHAAAATSQPSAAPIYPGAKVESADLSSMASAGAPSGKAFSTRDSFDTVYEWYERNLPAGSEQAHVTSPTESAVFLVGTGDRRMGVTIAPSPLCCRTIVVIAAFNG